jgi:hypothetical protein
VIGEAFFARRDPMNWLEVALRKATQLSDRLVISTYCISTYCNASLTAGPTYGSVLQKPMRMGDLLDEVSRQLA